MRLWIQRIVRWLVNAALVLFGLGAVGSYLPAIPILGELGPVLISVYGPWIAVLALVGAEVVFLRWRSNRKKRTLAVAVLAGFGAIGAIHTQSSQIAVARANGASINIAEAFLSGNMVDGRLRPTTVMVGDDQSEQMPLDIYPLMREAVPGGAPVFIYIHGGGWGAETLKQRQADMRWYAERGFLVLSLEYSLATKDRATWNIAQPQLGCALAWVNANVAQYGGDPGRVALWGESAGGNLALNVAYMGAGGTLRSECGGQPIDVQAVVALYPVVDPERMYYNPDRLMSIFGKMMTKRYTGGTPEEYPERYAQISSFTHINPAAPPTLLIIPEADHLVVPEAAEDFAAQASAAGIKVDYISVPYAEHSFDNRDGNIGNQLVRQTMLQFIQRQGLVP